MRMWLEWGIVGALCRTSESGAFLRCNLLCPDERPSHNGPSPAYEASMEQVCSLEGDYNGFTTDLTHSFATPPPPATFTSQKYHFVCAAANCHQLCYSFVGMWSSDEIESVKLKWKTCSAVNQRGLHLWSTQQHKSDSFSQLRSFVEIWVTSW